MPVRGTHFHLRKVFRMHLVPKSGHQHNQQENNSTDYVHAMEAGQHVDKGT